ncbi:DUF305 domain-containing protein [Streptomyces albipurpureus]|uniref:DUF305 domain-containing protein n=1 Tax=Streptomyces albipurpureus TaxID=2897419 RepID=A0ABT0UHS3_9ACTN|nr:DUF305 domain-containing protein [Streptomyces sp. CWNU-1]MCM2387650.1 DUF305 domain-containing protein [Streptomyces sp. CWNU-1]
MAFSKNTPRLRRRIALVSTVAAAGLVLAACGNDDDMDGMDHGSKSSTKASAPAGANPAPGAFNDADVMFAQTMIPHHEQALEMSELAEGRAADPEVKKLAAQIAQAQDPEIKKMQSWLKAWGKPASADSMPGMDHGSDSSDGSGMSGMMSEKDMKDLAAAKGTAFDKKFAQLMIDHHKGAVTMAEDEQKNGKNATAKKLADDVVKTQTTEINEFNKILGRL